MNSPNVNTPPITASAPDARRRRIFTVLGLIVVVVGVSWGLWEWQVGSKRETTDNAYVQGSVVQITPQLGGTVTAIHADDTDRVKAGQPLIQLDTADTRVALEQAQAGLAQAVRQARTLFANNGALAAQVKVREAEATRAQSELERLQEDLARRERLVQTGAVSREEYEHTRSQANGARTALAGAQAGVAAAREQLVANQAMTEGTTVEQHPSVRLAAARLREAWLASQRAALPAPVDGYVARRTVQVGQRVAPGTPVMSIVPLDQVWVEANFKEVQLGHIRIGQPVKLVADLYGSSVEYKGTVAGLGVGTGAAFALLPAQNATGNWIKVVQRVPVRIALDKAQLAAHPLRVGLSMQVAVDIREQSGLSLAEAPRTAEVARTQVYEALDRGADAEVHRIVSANLRGGAR